MVEDKLRDGMDVELLAEITNFLIGEWSGRPTTLSSVSSPTRNGTGPRSTVKRPARRCGLPRLPLDRFCNAVQWWVTQRVKDPERFVAELERPLGRREAVTDHDLERDAGASWPSPRRWGCKPPSPTRRTPPPTICATREVINGAQRRLDRSHG